MKYHKFWIEGYRGIRGVVEVDLRHRLLPIVGVNECGKTTILEAIFAFDEYNDEQNGGRHISDLQNLFEQGKTDPRVTAEIELNHDEYGDALDELQPRLDAEDIKAIATIVGHPVDPKTFADPWPGIVELRDELNGLEIEPDKEALRDAVRLVAVARGVLAELDIPTRVKITRHLAARTYSIEPFEGLPEDTMVSEALATAIVSLCRPIEYFDDFRHEVPEKTKIADAAVTTWGRILANLFSAADSNVVLTDLVKKEDRLRKSAIARAKKYLNETLTRQWQEFNLEARDALEVDLTYIDEAGPDGKTVPTIALHVIERDANDNENYFHIKDRSKGFYWFFNFVMRLEFRYKKPKDGSAPEHYPIYLLDEPGSYLHASAQTKLCKKLKALSNASSIVYCTHSHHLLEPDVIPFSAIHIASRSAEDGIVLQPITSEAHNSEDRKLAFQPVFEALQISPGSFALGDRMVVLVEGLSDFFAFRTFGGDAYAIVPCVNADSMRYVVSFMLASGQRYRAVWDHDKAGKEGMERAKRMFGDEEAARSFRLLPEIGKTKTHLEHLIDADELGEWKERIGLPDNTSYKKVLQALHYFEEVGSVVASSPKTRGAIEAALSHVWDEG